MRRAILTLIGCMLALPVWGNIKLVSPEDCNWVEGLFESMFAVELENYVNANPPIDNKAYGEAAHRERQAWLSMNIWLPDDILFYAKASARWRVAHYQAFHKAGLEPSKSEALKKGEQEIQALAEAIGCAVAKMPDFMR